MPGDERTLDATGLNGPAVPHALVMGEIELLGALPDASNHTFLVRCTAGDDEELAVYKPRRGETPLWDFPDGTLHRREIAAYRVARALGWPHVPPTVLRDGPWGPGSVQLFVEADRRHHFFTLEDSHAEAFRRVALFDLVINNADRKAGHCLLASDGTIWLVDHGVCFAVEPKLRTVIWTFVGEPIPATLLEDLHHIERQLSRAGALRVELDALLDPDEVEATRSRTAALVATKVFPEPGPGRPFPWPPI